MGVFISGLLLGVIICGIGVTIIVTCKRDVSDVNTNFCVFSSTVIHGLISKVIIVVIFCLRIVKIL